MTRLLLLVLPLGLVLIGCATDDDDDTAMPDDDVAGDFEAGQFAFATHAVDDGCLNGAAEAIYMPEGPAVPEDWESAIELPSFDQLPSSYTIDLPAPIGPLQITLEDGADDQFVMQAAVLEDMLFDEIAYPDCVVDATVTATLNVQTNDHVTGSVSLTNTDYEGTSCPQVQSDPCDVVLDVQADRL